MQSIYQRVIQLHVVPIDLINHHDIYNLNQTMKTSAVICVLASVASTNAFTVSNPARTQTALSADVSRNNFLKQVAGAGVAAAAGVFNPMAAFADEEVVKLPSGTSYVIVKSGDGPFPKVGELAGIKFRAKVVQSGKQIDDIFDFSEPYYTRVGSGGLIKVNIVDDDSVV